MTASTHIGRSRPRVEDGRLLTGQGRFIDDIRIDGCLHAAFVRSTQAHGRLRSVDVEEASGADGVVKIFVGSDLDHLGKTTVNPLMAALSPCPVTPLATAEVGAVGAPLAMVVATSAGAATDACDLVRADIAPLSPVPPSDLQNGDIRASEMWSRPSAKTPRPNPAARVAVSLRQALVAPTALEPRAIVADPESEPGRLTVWLGSQSPHRARDELAAVLGIDTALIRVAAPDVGGAFGMKASLYPEDIAVVFAAWTLDRCVSWTASRSEDFLAATQGRGQQIDASLSADSDGNFLSLEANLRAPLGHWMPYSAVVPARNAGRILPGPYRCDDAFVSAAGVATNGAAVGIYRGAGRPEAALTMELLIERLADALEIPADGIRKRNLIAPADMPWTTPTGQVLDSGDYAAAHGRAVELLAADLPAAAPRRASDPSRLHGAATIVYIEPSGTGWETARITLHPDGAITAATGSAAQGQGRVTATQQIVADHLGVEPDAISVVEGDSAVPDTATGALASRSTPIGGSALVEACRSLRDQAAAAIGGALAPDPDWQAVAQTTGPLTADATYEAAGEAWGYGAVGCAVSIDPETGALSVERLVWVDDAGLVINPMLAEGQMLGGIAQGIGEAVLERIVYDDDGQLLTGSFMDYGIPRADDMPPVTLERMETASPMNPLGAKGIGEAGAIGAPAAIACAVMDALRPLGVKHLDMPYTPARIWQAIQRAANTR